MKRLTILAVVALAAAVAPMTVLQVQRCTARDAHWIIEGRAATPCVDLNDVQFEESALREAAGRIMDYPTILLNHDQARPIGRILSARLEVDVLWVRAEISRTEPGVWAKIKDGTLSGLSVGVVPFAQETDWNDERGRTFTRVTRLVIVEVSVVSVPSNPRARIVAHTERRGR